LEFNKFRPFLELGTSYTLSSSDPDISVSFEHKPEYSFKGYGTKFDKFSGTLALGFNYDLGSSLSLGLKVDYQHASKFRAMTAGFGLGYRM
ncbi:MAG: autotransporter domain-containing protein, partial [Rickettsiales bacterium]|nr:autotransporter domain-containing protein [Rickettsiales bacterium]